MQASDGPDQTRLDHEGSMSQRHTPHDTSESRNSAAGQCGIQSLIISRRLLGELLHVKHAGGMIGRGPSSLGYHLMNPSVVQKSRFVMDNCTHFPSGFWGENRSPLRLHSLSVTHVIMFSIQPGYSINEAKDPSHQLRGSLGQII
jgi:hypothetical protein